MAGVELATAYFSLLPSMKGTAAAVTSQLGGVEVAAGAAGARTGAALGGGLVASFGKFIPILGGILLGAGLVDVFSSSIAAASDLQESTNAVSVSFGELSGEVGKLGDTAAERLGLSRNEFNQLATRFSSFAGTIAGEGGDVIGILDELTTRGADFASVYNLDVADALTLFQSGLAGETEPLRKYGIDLSAAAVSAFALANGIGDGTGALTESEKVQARYGLLLQETAKTQGDFANTSDSYATSQRILAARLEDTQAKLGEALLPAAEKFTDFMLNKGAPLVEKLVDLFIKLEPGISFVADATIGFLSGVSDNIGVLTKFFDLLSDGKVTASELSGVLVAIPQPLRNALTGAINFFTGIVNGFLAGVEGVVNATIRAVNTVITALGGQVSVLGVKLPRLSALSATTGRAPAGGGSAPLALAEGGLVGAVRGGVPAVVGEGRYDEAVIPLRPDVLRELGSQIAGAGGGSDLRPLMVRLIDAVEAKRVMVADGVKIAESAGRGFAFNTALGAA